MDLTSIIIQTIGKFWYLIPLAIIAAVLKSSWFKGIAGEFIVNLSAKLFLNKEQYHLIKNVTLPTEDGSTQIDHIIVSKYGVFVVETKNMKGWIFGSPNQKTWTQKIYKHSNKFQNPLYQNYKHVKTLESLLGLNDQQIYSVIVFIGDSTFKTDMPENVTYGGGYIRFIKSKNQPVLTDAEVNEITSKIENGRLVPSFKTNREHVKHVRTIVAEKENHKDKACPKCGSSMVMRETKTGQNIGKKFLGCSNFPKCRSIVDVT
jgi:ribosomal protein S27AE